MLLQIAFRKTLRVTKKVIYRTIKQVFQLVKKIKAN